MDKLIESERLYIRELNIGDCAFIVELLNDPDWIKNIGDRGVRTNADAAEYLRKGPLKSYEENGFGLFLVAIKGENTPIGMCGLIKREGLNDVDIGFAFLPEYRSKGYALESAQAVMTLAREKYKLNRVVAICLPENKPSVVLLEKIGLRFEKTITLPNDKTPLSFMAVDLTESAEFSTQSQ